MACIRLALLGVGDHRSGSSNPADRSVLYGDGVLFCQKLPKASQLVSGNQPVQEAFRELCGEKRHDDQDKVHHCRNGDGHHGNRLYSDEPGADWAHLPGGGVGLPYLVLFPGR